MPLLTAFFINEKVNTIIVGMGIAGICYAEILHQIKNFYIIDVIKKVLRRPYRYTQSYSFKKV